MGYTANEMFLLTPVDIKPDFSRQQFEELIRPLATGESGLLRFETIHQRKDSSTYHVSIRLQTAIWKGRAAFVAIVLDVSDQVHVREELAERDEQLQFMVDHLPGAAAYADHESGELRFNPMIGEITGYIPKELNTLDAFFSLLFGGDPRPREQYESFRLAWTDDEPLRLTIRRKDDQLRTVEFRGYGYDGHEVWLIHDVTERDRHETELRIRDRAIQAANEGVVIADATREGTPIVFVNRAFEELSGFSTQEAIGRGCELLCGADPDQRTLMELKSAVSGDDDFCRTIRCFRKCGKAFWNELSIAPVRSSDGAVTHIVAVMEAVSGRRNAQQLLLQSERLVAIGEMVTGLAHESRNALQRAQACLDMLSLDLEDHPEQLELTEKTTRALNDLHRLYEEVRNYAAPINLERRPTDLKKLWKRTWANLEDSWFGRDFKLVEGHNAASLICNVDEHRIEQVFRNIMENALAACADPGRLTINGSASTIADNDSVSISFRDNGSGLDDETAANIFQPFFTTKQKGTGLGMAISRRVVEAHGGCIRIAQPSSGAEIVVELPR